MSHGPLPTDKIWEHITFSGRGKSYYERLSVDVIYKDMYVFNEYYFFKALANYIDLQQNGLSPKQLKHIINSFSIAPVDSFLYELYKISTTLPTNAEPALFNSTRIVLIKLCDGVQQDNMHDFYDLGRSLVANFKILAKKYINHGAERKFVHLKEQNFIDLGLSSLTVFTNEHHVDGKYIIDTVSDEHKKLLGSIYPKQLNDIHPGKKPDWLYSLKPASNRISVPISGTLDGTGSTKKTDRCLQFDCILGNESISKSGAIELGIYSIGAIALASMFDLVCYTSDSDPTYKYIFYPFFKFNGDDDKDVVFKTKTVLMILVRYDPRNDTFVHEDILVNNRNFTVANVSKDIYKVHKTIEKATKANNTNIEWFNQLKTDNLFMGILKLCVPNNVSTKLENALGSPSAERPIWSEVNNYINNACHLYTKIKIFGKGLGDFNQAFEELVLNNLSNYSNGDFVLANNGTFQQPHTPTTPLALLSIDRNLAIICEIIGANFLLSSPGYFRTNPDAIYKKYKTLQKCHNAFNSVKIICVDDAHASTQPELSISTEDAENVQNLDAIDLKTWTTQPHVGDSNNYVSIDTFITREISLHIGIGYTKLGLVTASPVQISQIPPPLLAYLQENY